MRSRNIYIYLEIIRRYHNNDLFFQTAYLVRARAHMVINYYPIFDHNRVVQTELNGNQYATQCRPRNA